MAEKTTRGHWSGTVGGPEPDQKSRFGTHPSWHPGWGIGWHEDKESGEIASLYITDPTGAVVRWADCWNTTADHLACALSENAELHALITEPIAASMGHPKRTPKPKKRPWWQIWRRKCSS